MSTELYAILQDTLEVPDVDRLRTAFRSVNFLTDLDAHTLSQDGYGILVKRLSASDAQTVKSVLKRVDINVEVVPERSLPVLPATKFVHRLECSPEALIVYNPLGQSFPLEWNHILMVASGNVRLIEQKKVTTRRVVSGVSPYGSLHETEVVTDSSTREERNYHLVLDIILSGGVMRFSMNSSKFSWSCQGAKKTGSLAEDFRLLVRDLMHYAPHAAMNRGTYHFREKDEGVFSYPSKNAFYEEIVWLLWRMSQREE